MTEAVKELVAAAEECASRRYEPRLSKAVEAVQAEEKPQTHDFRNRFICSYSVTSFINFYL